MKQVSVGELDALLKSDLEVVLVDVRTAEERATAVIANSLFLFDDADQAKLEELDPDTPLIFYCHHGMRSQRVAEMFEERGHKRVCNLTGGIDAWSQEIDSSVARY